MDVETTRRAMELLREALEVAPAERRRFLAERCAGEEELREEVESLLAAEEGSKDFIEEPLVPRSPEDGLPEAREIGAYRLVERLAEGGMGEVYLAERADDEFEQQVAIKLVRRGFDSEEFVRRFRYERQILAQLDHPNIARLLDGGTTETGAPYFVMEHVEGVPVDRYCAERDLGLRERLRLFLEICEAVEFAHKNLVIHRDLKPANVLVSQDGVVKLLDFGIARLLETEEDSYRTRQVFGGPIFTPEYSSPEQLRGEGVTTASDVYSLGVLLYELLSGTRPFEIQNPLDPAMLEERQLGPTRPSRIGTGSDGDGDGTGESVLAFRSRLAGDLDAIVVKALRYEVEERYGSVAQLVDDLERYLAGRPVLARRGSWLYATGKYLRRYRVEAILLALLGSLIFSLWSNFDQQRHLVRDQARAQVMQDLLGDILSLADPQSDAEASTPREILERAAERAEEKLAAQPADLAEILSLMGQVFRHLGEIERAREMHERSVALVRRHLGAHHPLLAYSLNDLVAVMLNQEDYAAAETAAREALAIAEAQFEPDRELLGALYNNLASSHARRGDPMGAEPYYRQALEIKLELVGEKDDAHADDDDLARAYNNLGWALELMGELEEAERNYELALRMRERLFEDHPHPDLAVSYNNLGVLYCNRGDPEVGLPLVERSLELRRRVYPRDPDHPRISRALRNLGVCYQVAGDLEHAAELYFEALDKQSRKLGRGEPGEAVARTLREIADLQLARGDATAALETSRRALEIFERVYETGDHWRIADARSIEGGALWALGRIDEARPLLEESVAALEKQRPRSRPLREARERHAGL